MKSKGLESAEQLPEGGRKVGVILLEVFVAIAAGAFAAIMAFLFALIAYMWRKDQIGVLAMFITPLIGFGGGAWYGWRLMRRATGGRYDG